MTNLKGKVVFLLAMILLVILIVNVCSGILVAKLNVGFTFWDGFFNAKKVVPEAMKMKSDKIFYNLLNI